MKDKEIKELKQLLDKPRKIAIVPHKNADGDAIGASLGVYHFLKAKGHSATVISPNNYPDFLKWLPGSREVIKFDMQNRQAQAALDTADVLFILDFNAFHRVGPEMEKALNIFKGTVVMIDHHLDPDPIAQFTYSDVSMSSTCEMIYHLLVRIGEAESIGDDVATSLYTGIMTDTGSFRYPSTTSTTHRVVAHLIEQGADNSRIYNRVFDTNSYGRLQLLGRALSNLVVIEHLRTAYITLTQDELDEFNFQKGDTEGVVNYALSLEGIVFAAIFIEDREQEMIKISFRSKGTFSVNTFARHHFEGGGHDNAAGGKAFVSLDSTVSRFLNVLPDYKKLLINSYED
jgi:phosphoesterase RecJ-like protein